MTDSTVSGLPNVASVTSGQLCYVSDAGNFNATFAQVADFNFKQVTTFPFKGALAGSEEVFIDDAGVLTKTTTQEVANLAPIPTQREMFFDVQTNANYLSYRVRSLGSSGSYRFDFNTPSDFVTLVSVGLIIAPTGGAAGVGKSVDITSDYGPIGGSTSLFGGFFPQVYDFGPADQWVELDISPAFLNIGPSQVCGFLWDHNGVGGTSYVEAIHLVYDTV